MLCFLNFRDRITARGDRMTTVAERIREALEIRGMRQSDLVQATGIGKSSISTYLSGSYLPKQQNIYKIAQALDVNVSWLMGYDVPMDVEKPTPVSESGPISPEREALLLAIKDMDDETARVLLEMAKSIRKLREK